MFPFKTALNVSTLFPFNLDVVQQASVAAEAGFEGIELWVRDIDAYLAKGGSLKELRGRLASTGLTVANAIAFFPWADADAATRAQGLAQAERELQMLAELGCLAVAAPPFGQVENVSLPAMAGYLARLVELARKAGVEPYLEFWGRSKTLSKLSEALFVAAESGMPAVKILIDGFHMHVGGSNLTNLSYVKGSNIGIVHVNDYPAVPGRADIADRDRVFPGEGVAPTHEFAQLIHDAGYRGYLSLELFIEDYRGQSALEVAQRGLRAVKDAYRVEA